MTEKTDKRTRAAQFRTRLGEAMQDRGTSQSALARQIGVDRSTVSQLLGNDGARLPNAQVVGECAAALGVSADWLLSLTDRPETTADILSQSLTMTEAPRALVDEQIFRWHQEAAGYKIRHVPAGLPDMLKTRAMLEWEYAPHMGRSIDQAIGASQDRLDWMRGAQSDYEIAMPQYEIDCFAKGVGYYEGLPLQARLDQIDHPAGSEEAEAQRGQAGAEAVAPGVVVLAHVAEPDQLGEHAVRGALGDIQAVRQLLQGQAAGIAGEEFEQAEGAFDEATGHGRTFLSRGKAGF